jgi:hypothetical protein
MRNSTRKSPALELPKTDASANGAVRLGSSTHSADLPEELKLPPSDVKDAGAMRLGSSTHSADLPV